MKYKNILTIIVIVALSNSTQANTFSLITRSQDEITFNCSENITIDIWLSDLNNQTIILPNKYTNITLHEKKYNYLLEGLVNLK